MNDKSVAINFIMRVESGETITEQEASKGFQALISSGLAWKIQGSYSYSEVAHKLIECGLCINPQVIDGNIIH